jgi:phage-related protein
LSLPKKDQAEVLRVVDLLQEFGLSLGMPHARPIAGMWELRAGGGLLFYVAYMGRRFIILHGYLKQGQKAPAKEIKTAERRWADFLEREA